MTPSRLFIISILLLFFATQAHATIYRVSGEVTEGTGAMGQLTPPGVLVNGYFEFESDAVAAGLAEEADINAINIAFGGFCLGYVEYNCPGALIPLIQLDFATVTFDDDGIVTGGLISAFAYSPIIELNFSFIFDFNQNRIWMEDIILGSASADTMVYQAVPLPATLWLLVSGLVVVANISRNPVRKRTWRT